MNPLRAVAGEKDGWWGMRLLDLDVRVDGASEDEVLSEVARSLAFEYTMARRDGRVPFQDLVIAYPRQRITTQQDDTALRRLNLPDEVRDALASVFRTERSADFCVEVEKPAA